LNVEDKFIINAEQLTISGTINLLSGTAGLGSTNFPGLKYFTNYGTINVPSSANFGFDRVTPLLGFVNTGAISAVSILIRADEVENAGSIAASLGSVSLNAETAKLEGGLFRSGSSTLRGGDIKLDARSVKFRNYAIQTGGTIQFNVTNSLFDSGGRATTGFRGA